MIIYDYRHVPFIKKVSASMVVGAGIAMLEIPVMKHLIRHHQYLTMHPVLRKLLVLLELLWAEKLLKHLEFHWIYQLQANPISVLVSMHKPRKLELILSWVMRAAMFMHASGQVVLFPVNLWLPVVFAFCKRFPDIDKDFALFVNRSLQVKEKTTQWSVKKRTSSLKL